MSDAQQKLLMMARQIEGYFTSYPAEIAAPQVAGHINAFWSRKMRQDFLNTFSADDERLGPLLRKAYGSIKTPV